LAKFFDKDLLQLFDFERFIVDQTTPSARGLLLKFQRRPRPNHSRHLKSSNADPPNQPWRTFFGGKIKVEALENGVPPRHDSHCLSRALAPSDA